MFFKRFKASDMKDTYEKAKIKRQKDMYYIYDISIKRAFKDIKKAIKNGERILYVYLENNIFIKLTDDEKISILNNINNDLIEYGFQTYVEKHSIFIALKESIK